MQTQVTSRLKPSTFPSRCKKQPPKARRVRIVGSLWGWPCTKKGLHACQCGILVGDAAGWLAANTARFRVSAAGMASAPQPPILAMKRCARGSTPPAHQTSPPSGLAPRRGQICQTGRPRISTGYLCFRDGGGSSMMPYSAGGAAAPERKPPRRPSSRSACSYRVMTCTPYLHCIPG